MAIRRASGYHFVCDLFADLASVTIPGGDMEGSTAYVIATSQQYIYVASAWTLIV